MKPAEPRSNGAFSYSIRTMGCKANTYDSLLLEQQLQALGGVIDDTRPDVFVLNSCTVTSEADRQCRREISAAKKRSPESFTVLAGCFAQAGGALLKADPEFSSKVDLVLDNDGKSGLGRAVANHFGLEAPQAAGEATQEMFWGELPTVAGRTRSFVKIQEGCNDNCTYCIIPRARGASRSVPMRMILAEIQRLALVGVQEVVLTGTNIADYGMDQGSDVDGATSREARAITLETLVEAILTHTNLRRLRLTSLDPTEITDGLIRMLSYEGPQGGRLMPHFHVSLQSPVSRVLRAMKRAYRREEVASALTRLASARRGLYVGMDVISGFPSETDDEHREALATLAELPWTRLHVFPYSEREGTPATRIKEIVPVATRKARAQELMSLSLKRHEEFARSFEGHDVEGILFETVQERDGRFFLVGHAPNYVRVMADSGAPSLAEAHAWCNRIGVAHITGRVAKPAQDWTLIGRLVEPRSRG